MNSFSTLPSATAKTGVPASASLAQTSDFARAVFPSLTDLPVWIPVIAGLGVGLLAEMAFSGHDTDLRAWVAPAAIPECIAWAVLPRDRVLRDYALELVHALAPQIDPRDLRRVLDGNQQPDWPDPPSWESLTQTLTM